MRTTGVKLIADLIQYKREMRDGAKVTRDVKDEIDDTATASDKLGDKLGKAAKSSKREVEELRKTAGDLDKQIAETRKGLADLAKTYASTGDSGILKSIKEQQKQLRQLKNVRSLLPDADEVAKAGAGIGGQLVGGIRTALTSASPAALGAGAIGLLLAPTIGAAVAGAVVGAAGIGGVIGGLTLAAQNDQVKTAGKQLGQFILGDLEARAASFVPAALDGIERLKAGWKTLGPDLDAIFTSSRFVAPLAQGGVKGAQGFISGFADAVEEADPVINAISTMVAELGTVTGDTFRLLAQDAKEGASAIDDLTIAISHMVTATGQIIHAGAAVKGWSDQLDVAIDKGRYWIEDNSALADKMKLLGLQLDLTADGFKVGTVEAEAYRKATLGTATSVDFATLKTAGMTDAQIAAADASGTYRIELDKVAAGATNSRQAQNLLVATEDDVKKKTEESTRAQTALTHELDSMGVGAGRAAKYVEGLQKATQNLYGAQEHAIDVQETYEASWDSLSDAVKRNKASLDVHTAAGRANRDALQSLLKSSRDMYFADIESGTAVADAAKKHRDRTKAIEVEANRLQLNRGETKKLIETYGKIPPKRQTDLVLDGVNKVVNALMDLYVYQRSLAEGIPIGSVRAILNKEKGPAKKYGGYHSGGYTGDGGKHEPAGVVHRGEFVMRKEATTSLEATRPGLLSEMNATGQLPGHASGGWVGLGPVETRSGLHYKIEAGRTRIPSRKQVAAKAVPEFSQDWPSSPAAQRGDSGVWRKIVALIKSTGPMSGSFGNAFRPGDPLWHGSGRALDWMGFNQDNLATFLSHHKPLELIHRTNRRDYAYTRGVNKGSFNNALMEAHRNHIHIAMKNGGTIQEPIVGVGASGNTYSFGEGGIHEKVVPMSGGTAGGSVTNLNLTVNAPVGSHPREIGREILSYVGPYLESGGELRLSNGTKVL